MADTQINIEQIRSDFEILNQKVNGHQLVYFDNAASTQKPKVVSAAIADFYNNEYSNIHRGVHHFSELGTEKFEAVRGQVKHFLNAKYLEEIIFTSGTTASINLVADCFARDVLQKGDQVVISHLEHHSNIVPWQMACEKSGAELKVIGMTSSGELDYSDFEKLLNDKVKIIAINHVSNALGTINDIEKIISQAKALNIPVLIDGAQAVAHLKVDIQALGADFYCFSAHKLFGPTGVGVLYGKKEWLERLNPYMGGGDMINEVRFEKTTYNDLPHKFEAGTPNIAGVIGFGKALEYVSQISIENIKQAEAHLLDYATKKLSEIGDLEIKGVSDKKAAVISFVVNGLHPYDIGTLLNQYGIAVRTGHHCTQPIMEYFNISGTVRASFSFYNTTQEIDFFVEKLQKVIQMLK